MKKVVLVILVLALSFILSGCIFEEACIFYSHGGEKDGFGFGVNKLANCCFVDTYNCYEYTENMEITIPDEFDGMPVTRMGGYVGRGAPCPFMISISTAPDGSEMNRYIHGRPNSEGLDIKYLVFNLNIGKNIEVFEEVTKDRYFSATNADGIETYYLPVFNVNCSSENKSFYSKDGKLYDKKTDELIEVFDYAADFING